MWDINTAAGTRYGYDDYVGRGCGMGREATLYLLERGVRVTGTDAWSWDAPFGFTRQRIAETGNSALFWEGHLRGRHHTTGAGRRRCATRHQSSVAKSEQH
jgi:kynurenine formamidase